MKTIIVLSDSHGRRSGLEKIAPLFAENDLIIHLGDGSGDMRDTNRQYPDKTYVFKGNNDFSFGLDECVVQAEGISVFCCHGHRYGVKKGLGSLARRAKELGCEAAFYGHTHIAAIERVEGVLCMNPGAIGSYANASYGYVVVHGNKITPVIVNI